MSSHNNQEIPEDVFGDLLASEIPGLYRYAYSLVGGSAEAGDAVGETLLRALEHRGQYRKEASLRTWLHRILRNTAIDRARHFGRETLVDEVERDWSDETYTVDAEGLLERIELRGELQAALAHLPVIYREVIVLHDAEDWATSEIAAMLDLEIPAVKQRLRRGRMMLVSSLAKEKERKMANVGVPMSCVDARYRVSDYIDGELPADQARVLESHLANCATCPSLYQSLVGVTRSLGELRDPDSVVPPKLAVRIGELLTTQDGTR